mmetsp:Transcript_25122/g.58076  ORF Transcript_25122/g.58076 Transcript_25122/m.58076 type:complete len:215 (-) Transcript_25122:792-1436(-)
MHPSVGLRHPPGSLRPPRPPLPRRRPRHVRGGRRPHHPLPPGPRGRPPLPDRTHEFPRPRVHDPPHPLHLRPPPGGLPEAHGGRRRGQRAVHRGRAAVLHGPRGAHRLPPGHRAPLRRRQLGRGRPHLHQILGAERGPRPGRGHVHDRAGREPGGLLLAARPVHRGLQHGGRPAPVRGGASGRKAGRADRGGHLRGEGARVAAGTGVPVHGDHR